MKSNAKKRHREYKKKVARTLQNSFLRETLGRFANDYLDSRSKVLTDKYFEQKRNEIKDIKTKALDKINNLTAQFKARAEQGGAKVFQAKDGNEAIKYILDIAKRRHAKLIVKSKSMATEEIQLNKALELSGIEVCETDLGEWIIQLAGERPSHMVMPAIHLTRKEVAELFTKHTGQPQPENIPHLVKVAREKLRQKFLSADIGITGANIGVAETGALIIISNEGNARLSYTMPPVHIVLMGYDKLVRSMKNAATILDILPKNATGQAITSYISIIKGAAEGKELHIILLDNGRLSLAQDEDFKEALRCIRCGACANVCPVYQIIGGHLFGHIYVGAIGIVLTAFIHGIDNAAEPMQSCISCRKCVEICPAGIDLEDLIQKLRKKLFQQQEAPFTQNLIFNILSKPKLFHTLLRAAWLGQQPFSRGKPSIRHLPLVFSDWTKNKTLPAIVRKPLRSRWHKEIASPSGARNDNQGKRIKAAFFSGCLIDFVFPNIGQSIQKVLSKYNIELDYLTAQSCCGYPAWYSGDIATARKLAEHHIAIFSNPEYTPAVPLQRNTAGYRYPYPAEAGRAVYKYIITGCPTCALSFKRNYPKLLADSPLKKQAKEIAVKTFDFSEFLQNVLKIKALPNPASGTPLKVTFHDSCHMRRSLGIYQEPRQLITDLAGCELVEMKYPDRCCGQGGSYSIKYPGISDAILDKKTQDIAATNTEAVVSCCPGCLMHIKGGLEKKDAQIAVKHIAELLSQLTADNIENK